MDVRGNEEKALEKQTAYEKEKQIHDICIHDFQPDSTLVQAEISPFVALLWPFPAGLGVWGPLLSHPSELTSDLLFLVDIFQ